MVGVCNTLALKPRAACGNISTRIREALNRQAGRQAKGIDVTVDGATVVLRGSVHSLAERTAAAGAAWSAPGITRVDNGLRVGP